MNGGFASGKGLPGTQINGFKIFSFAFASDDERENMLESFGDQMVKNLGYEVPYEIDDDYVELREGQFSYLKGQTWYYEYAPIKRIDEYDNGDYGIVFEDDSLPQIGKSGKNNDFGDARLVFYVANEYESNGETKIEKEIFWDVSADEHVYIGTHGAYER